MTAKNDDKYTYMLTVPNNLYKKLFVTQQLISDKGLAAEWSPELSSDVVLKDKRSIDELYNYCSSYQRWATLCY